MGIVDNIKDKLSGSKHNEQDTTTTHTHVGTADHHTTGSGIAGTHNTPGSGLTASHNNDTTGGGLTGSHHNTGSGLTGSHHNTGSGITGGTAVGGEHTYTHAGHPQPADFVPGSHPSAHNSSAIPTAGGERVGGLDNTHNTHGTHGTHDNRSGMEKIKDKVVPSRTDRPDDPITGQNYGQSATSGSGHHGQSGLTGSHGTSAATPLAHDSSFNDRHNGSGLTGNAHSGSGLTGNTHSGSGLTGNTHAAHTGHGLGGHDQYAAGGVDNRSGMEKIKDKAVPSRTDRPDDALTGQNYGQNSGTGNHASGAHTGSHVPGTTHSGQGSHLVGDQTYSSGVGGVGSNQTHGTGVGHTGAYDNTPGSGFGGHSTTTHSTTTHSTTTGKPSLMDKLNPKKDADHDGKAGFMK